MKRINRIFLTQLIFPLIYGLVFYFFSAIEEPNPVLSLFLFTAGLYIGQAILWLDAKWFYQYYNPPSDVEPLTAETEELPPTSDIPELITRSLLFMLSLIPLSIYILTSTGSTLGVGVLLGILVGLSIEIIVLKNDLLLFQQHFFFQLRRVASEKETDRFIYGFVIFTALVSAVVLL